MDLSWDYKLKNDERSNPVVLHSFPSIVIPTIVEKDFDTIFGHKKGQLKTWGNISTSTVHFIAVQKGTPLHRDPGYNRYSHQLILYVDEYITRGLDKVETPLYKGMYHILDGYSPHQLLYVGDKSKIGRYVAIAVDNENMLPISQVLPQFEHYLSEIESVAANVGEKNL